ALDELAAADIRDTERVRLLRAVIRAEGREGKAALLDEYRLSTRVRPGGTSDDLYPLLLLRLAGPGHREETLRACQSLRAGSSLWAPTKRDWYLKLLEFSCGL